MGNIVRENWPLLATIGVLLGGAAIVYVQSGQNSAPGKANAAVMQTAGGSRVINTAAVQRPERKTPQEMALEQIAEHEETIEADPDNADTPAYLMAMGNLYRQKLVDYEKAAECYERVLVDHADWDNIRLVYMQLATCYERLDQKADAKRVYEKMLEVFPADSQEHAIAHAAVFR